MEEGVRKGEGGGGGYWKRWVVEETTRIPEEMESGEMWRRMDREGDGVRS